MVNESTQRSYLQSAQAELTEQTSLPTTGAANYIGVAADTLKKARWSNKLCGVEPPIGTRRGKNWFYRIKDLDEWLAQFEVKVS